MKFLFSMVMPNRKAIRLLEFRICLFMFLLHAVLYLKISEICVHKHSTVAVAEMLQNLIQRFSE